ncbi:MAG: right-handed parallel beta-helix repeat-containing protein [bacterium]|nr:right-handed parallel beta-helix repeat-containing protein [bacterium]
MKSAIGYSGTVLALSLLAFATQSSSPRSVQADQHIGGQEQVSEGLSTLGTAIRTLPYTITSCGSYFLVACLTGAAGQDGITVMATDVTLDLNGFTLQGAPGSLDAIKVAAGDRRDVLIKNGVIRDWGSDGVEVGLGASFSHEVAMRGLTIVNNAGYGITTGSETTTQGCFINNNASGGIAVGGGSVVTACFVRDNGGHGIEVDNDCWVFGNYVDDQCSGSGIRLSSETATVQNNTVSDCQIGIEATAPNNLIVQNRVSAPGACGGGVDYSVVAGNRFAMVSSDPDTAGHWANFSY